MATYAATFDSSPPETYDRAQLFLRIAIIVVLSILAGAIGWIFGAVYLVIPVLAAIMISQKGAAGYLSDAPNNMIKWLRLFIGFYAYLALLTDKLPSDTVDTGVRFDVTPTGTPSVGQALLRIILGIPHAIVLGLLSIVVGVLIIIAAIMILIQQKYPEGIYSFNRGFVRWQARLYAYMASLVDEYPPFAFDTGTESAAPALPPVAQTGDQTPPAPTA